MLVEPKFQKGDRVLHKRTKEIYTVLDRVHSEAQVTYAITESSTTPTTIAEHWMYKLNNGKSYQTVESLLENA